MLSMDDKRALAALEGNQGVLTSALEAIKNKFLNEIYQSEPHEKNKREDLYLKSHLVDELRSVIKDAVNKSI